MYSIAAGLLITVLVLESPVVVVAQNQQNLSSCLNNAGLSYLNKDSGNSWTTAIKPYNQRLVYTPVAVVEPKNAQQVAAAVKCGVDAQYRINPRGGGHSYAAAAFGGADGHLMIDLKNLNTVVVDGEQAIIGGGGKLGSIALELDKQGRGMAHGLCPYVGIGGHGAYGGFGYFSRNWGMVVDQVTSLQVVTFDGQIRNVSSTGNDTELFYALRGAGGSYGIITAFGVKTHATPSAIVHAIYQWDNQPVNATASILAAYQNWSSTSAPKEWGSTLNLVAGSSRGLVNMSFTTTYMGNQSTYNNVIASFLAQVPTPTTPPNPTSQNWTATLQLLAGNQNLNTSLAIENQDTFYTKSIMTPQSSPMSFDALKNFANYLATTGVDAANNNQQDWFVQVELYGGANSQVNSIAMNDTAFVHRSSLFTFQFWASSANFSPPFVQSGYTLVDGMVSSITQTMGSNWGFEAYQNFVDTNLSATDAQSLYWGSAYSKLQSIKQKYDPRDVFQLPSYQAIALPSSSQRRKQRRSSLL